MREGKKAKTQWFAAFVSGRPCDGGGGGGGTCGATVREGDSGEEGREGPRMIKPPRDGNFSCPIINYRAALPPHARDQCVTSYEKNFSRYYN